MRHTFLIILMALFTLSLVLIPGSINAQEQRCFEQTGYCIEGPIREYWEANGGLPVFGYPITPLRTETVEDWTGPTQWFERDRLEDHDRLGVMAGRLGARILELEGRPWQTFETVEFPEEGCRYFSETKHSMCEPFRSYWENNGGLERFGYPITEAFTADIEDWTGTIQYFERRRMEHHTEHAGTQYEVLLGLLGNELQNRDGAPEQPIVTETPESSYPEPDATATPMDKEAEEPTATPTEEAEPTNTPTPEEGDISTATPTEEEADEPTVTPTEEEADEPTVTPTPEQSTNEHPEPGECLSAEEAELARLVNAYRNENGLSDVPVSKSLSHVAQAHVIDLHEHEPDSGTDSRGMECNLHSWSDQGDWSAVCYTDDHEYAEGMWDKPREITDNAYTGNGYENAHGTSGQATASGALSGWQNSPPHNAVILEQDGWSDWQAMGVGVYEHHAVLWFGHETDPQGTIDACQ
jgi:uncharacterized protein YkwD